MNSSLTIGEFLAADRATVRKGGTASNILVERDAKVRKAVSTGPSLREEIEALGAKGTMLLNYFEHQNTIANDERLGKFTRKGAAFKAEAALEEAQKVSNALAVFAKQ